MCRVTRLLLCAVLFLFLIPLAAFADDPAAPTTPLLEAIEMAASSALTGAGTPAPVLKASCTADQTCPNQCFIHCDGVSSCTVTATSVTCDGNTTSCPYPSCTPPSACLSQGTGCEYCDCRAQGGTAIQCTRAWCRF